MFKGNQRLISSLREMLFSEGLFSQWEREKRDGDHMAMEPCACTGTIQQPQREVRDRVCVCVCKWPRHASRGGVGG